VAEPLTRLPGGQRLWFWLTDQRAGLRRYHWLLIAVSALTALAVAVPRLIAQPTVFYATAAVTYDPARYAGIELPVDGQRSGLDIAFADTLTALRLSEQAEGRAPFGTPQQRVDLLPQQSGTILVRGVAGQPDEAQRLADAAALQLVRQIRAAGGREILRNLLGHQLWQSLSGSDSSDTNGFSALLRDILRLDAFPMSRPIEPFAAVQRLADLDAMEIQDAARALEARSILIRDDVNRLNSDLDRSCQIVGVSETAAREQRLTDCITAQPALSSVRAARDRAVEQLRAVDAATTYLIRSADARFNPDLPSTAYRQAAALPAAAEPRYVLALSALALLVGTVIGAAGVAVDRSAGLLAKVLELWQYRELIQNLILRDLRARYKGSALGYLWTQIAPLGMMLVYVIVFGLLLPSSVALYPIFVIAGLLPWNFTAEAVLSGTRSVIDNAPLVKRTYFPREVLPLVAVGASLVNFILSLPMLLLVMIVVQLSSGGQLIFSWSLLYLPVIMLLHTLLLAGVVLLLSAAAVFLRDVVHLVGIAINIWFFLTPIIYPLSVVGNEFWVRLIRWLNPLASLVEFYREVIYGNPVAVGLLPTPGVPALTSMLRIAVTAFLLLGIGSWFFQRFSQHFGEEL
jgi:lipopolysaccharide transport system permease protein